MGTKGSFIIASITDHYFIEMVARIKYGSVTPYMKVGDDLVISDVNNELSSNYPLIGVPVNQTKSKMKTPRGHFLEFVSRNLWNGQDISPISARLAGKVRKQNFFIPSFIRHCNERISHKVTLEAVAKALSIDESQINKIIYLADLYQRISGEIYLEIPSDAKLASDDELLGVLINLLLEIPPLKFKKGNPTPDERMEVCNILSGQAEEYILSGEDLWLFATNSRLSLDQLRLFTVYLNTQRKLVSSYSTDKDIRKRISIDVRVDVGEGKTTLNPVLLKTVWEFCLSQHEDLRDLKTLKSTKLERLMDSKLSLAIFTMLNRNIKNIPKSIDKQTYDKIKYLAFGWFSGLADVFPTEVGDSATNTVTVLDDIVI